jgi:hypothetical protein
MPGPTPPPALPPALTAAVAAHADAIRAAWKAAAEAIDAWPDPAAALLAAGELDDVAAELPPAGAALRGRQARRLRERDKLSLAGLGERLGELGLGEPGKDKKPLAQKLVRAGTPEGAAP